ncbi:glycosyltransferase, partial [bacterium]|nr:glycosyltransferase [bacterium]
LTAELCNSFRKDLFCETWDSAFVVSVGRLTKSKNLLLLLDAAVLLKEQNFKLNILVIGDGPERTKLEISAEKLDVSMIFTGSRYDEKYLSLAFASADMLVMTGRAGLPVIHSLYYGTPVVGFSGAGQKAPEFEAIKPMINGASFRQGDAKSLSEAIVMVFRELPRGYKTAQNCRESIDIYYSSRRMRKIFDQAVSGISATFDWESNNE